MKCSAPCFAVLRYSPSSWAAVVHWSALTPKALRSSRKHLIHSFSWPPTQPAPPTISPTTQIRNIPGRGRLHAESTALLTERDPPLVRVKQVIIYALHHRLFLLRQSRVPESGHSAYRARNVQPCHRCRPHERPQCLPARKLQHIFLLLRSLRLIRLKKGLEPPKKLVSSLPSRCRICPPST